MEEHFHDHFYDIESLSNVFTLCDYYENHVDIYYINDNIELSKDFVRRLTDCVHEKNDNFDGSIKLINLANQNGAYMLACQFGLSDAYKINDTSARSSYYPSMRMVCDTDPEYIANPDKYPYFFGYNSDNYDLTMLAELFYRAWPSEKRNAENGRLRNKLIFKPVTAKYMREVNDLLFTPEFKDKMPSFLEHEYEYGHVNPEKKYNSIRAIIRRNFLMTGRHIDVAKLNEKQQYVALKRLLGMIGCQILESNKLKPNQSTLYTEEELCELIAYNVSDCVNLKELFNNEVYHGTFELKKGLLETYPELVYECVPDGYAPCKHPSKVRRDRLIISSSSAKMATYALCPYGRLKDMEVVSFNYPSKEKAEELGIPVTNVLEETRKFFYEHFPQPALRAKFDTVYNYYKSIEGKNFNGSRGYKQDYPKSTKVYRISDLPKVDSCMPYFKKDGTPSDCFVKFSVGGIHGAQYNLPLYEADLEAYEEAKAELDYVKSIYPDPNDLRIAKTVTTDDCVVHKYSDYLKSGGTIKKRNCQYKELAKPVLFEINDDGSSSLAKKYVFTSVDMTNHEDFTSYYPSLLMMMRAFWNSGLGYDRYAEIFGNKEKYGKLKKQAKSEEEKKHYDILRNGTKLILNSASGAADSEFESPIRMNNTIIAMRIIGQLYTYTIGQAQAYVGAKITSTNTDGLYSVLEEELNNKILAKESARIGVAIEPEPLFLISKDSNNRLEMVNGKITVASGGTLGCMNGPNPSKALSHPAIVDWVLAQYLAKTDDVSKDFDSERGMDLLVEALTNPDVFARQAEASGMDAEAYTLNMFQQMAASSPSSNTYIYAKSDDETKVLQHYNRIFFMQDNVDNTYHLKSATFKIVQPKTLETRKKEYIVKKQAKEFDGALDEYILSFNDPEAVSVLQVNGIDVTSEIGTRQASPKKINGIEEEWACRIENRSLRTMSQSDKEEILKNIDLDKYLEQVRSSYEENWKNILPKEKEPFVPVAEDTPSLFSAIL